MEAIIKIKQVPDESAVSTGLDKYNRSRMPHCSDTYQVAQGFDDRYITGIDENSTEINSILDKELKLKRKEETKELREKLEGLLGKDLSGTSKYWTTFFINISTDSDLILNLSNPLHVIYHKALIANGLAAPNLESAGMPRYRNAKYYCFVEEQFEQEQVSTQKARDKATSLLFSMAENSDKMLLIGQYLEGFKYKRGMRPDTLYSMLTTFIKAAPENIYEFTRAAQTDVESLQYKITVDKAIKSKIIKFKEGQYYRGGTNLGKTLSEVLSTLKSPEYANEFLAIHEEVVI